MLTLYTTALCFHTLPTRRCTSRRLNKLTGDRNTMKVFIFFSRWLQMRDRWEFWSLFNLPNSLPTKQILKTSPNEQGPFQLQAECCKPTLALLSSRVRLQFAAHYRSRPEREQHTPDCLLAPDSIPNFLYRRCTDVFDRNCFSGSSFSFCFFSSKLQRWRDGLSPQTFWSLNLLIK